MAISFNTGTTTTVSSNASPSGTLTIPAGVLAGDLILVMTWIFTTATGSITGTLSSAATAPVLVGTQTTASGSSILSIGSVWSISAGSGDHGATLTFGATGGTGGSYWVNAGLADYTGALGGVDVSNQTEFFSGSSTGTTTFPSATTMIANDWQVLLFGVGPPGYTGNTPPAGITTRESVINNAGTELFIGDSNGSVGAAGTGIGGQTWTLAGSSGNTWSNSFVVGIAPTTGGAPASPGRQLPNRPYLQVFSAGPSGRGSSY